MENKGFGQRVRELRLQNGLSQVALSEKADLNLRTIQRIESGSTIPRGDTLQRLSEALKVSPDELIDCSKQVNTGFLSLMNISSLTFILNPILGIIIPLALWVSKRDKIENVDEYGKTILNFQISLLIFLSLTIIGLGIIMLIGTVILKSDFLEWIGPIVVFYIPVGFYYIFNSVKILLNLKRIHNDQTLKYAPIFNIVK